MPEPQLDLACLDASLCLNRRRTVPVRRADVWDIISLDLYPKLLNFAPVVRHRYRCLPFDLVSYPLVVSKGDDQRKVSTRFESRDGTWTSGTTAVARAAL